MYLFLKIKLIRNRNYCTNYTNNYANTDTKYNARFVTSSTKVWQTDDHTRVEELPYTVGAETFGIVVMSS